MKGYTLHSEKDTHFEVNHPKDGLFKVAKNQLDKKTQEKIRKLPQAFADGGQAVDPNAPAPIQGDKSLYNAPLASQIPALPGGGAALYDAPMASPLPLPTVSPEGQPIPAEQSANTATPEELEALKTKLEGEQATKAAETKVNPNTAPGGGMQMTSAEGPGAPMPSMAADAQKALDAEAAGIRQREKAEQQFAVDSEKHYQEYINRINQAGTKRDESLAQNQAEHDQIVKGIQDQKIDPNRVWSNAGTGNTVLAAIGVMLSGVGSGLAGGPNLALGAIDKAIDRDIEAQRAELGKKENLLSDNLRKYGNINAAYEATSMQLHSVVQAQIAQASAKSQSGVAQANAQTAMSQLSMKRTMLAQQLADRAYLANGGGNDQGVDPQRLRLAIRSGVVPEKEVPGAMKEFGEYNKLGASLNNIQAGFDKVAKLQTASERAGSPLQSKSQIDAIEKLYSAQLAKDLEGRATPQDIESLMENFPKLSDNDETRTVKLNNMKDSIKAKYSFPTLTAYGVINQNSPTIKTSSEGTNRSNKRDFAPKGGAAPVLTSGKR